MSNYTYEQLQDLLAQKTAECEALALWREEVQSHVERDCAGSDQWHDELVELVADSYSLNTSLARRDAEKQAEALEKAAGVAPQQAVEWLLNLAGDYRRQAEQSTKDPTQ